MNKYKILAILCVLFLHFYSFGQNNIRFDYAYDNSGNRISRAIFDLSKKVITKSDTTVIVPEIEYIDEQEVFNTSLDNININIFPNPVNDVLYIEISEFQTNENIIYEIFDFNGKKIEKNNINSSNTSINFYNFNPGSYILRISNKTSQQEFKVIKD